MIRSLSEVVAYDTRQCGGEVTADHSFEKTSHGPHRPLSWARWHVRAERQMLCGDDTPNATSQFVVGCPLSHFRVSAADSLLPLLIVAQTRAVMMGKYIVRLSW